MTITAVGCGTTEPTFPDNLTNPTSYVLTRQSWTHPSGEKGEEITYHYNGDELVDRIVVDRWSLSADNPSKRVETIRTTTFTYEDGRVVESVYQDGSFRTHYYYSGDLLSSIRIDGSQRVTPEEHLYHYDANDRIDTIDLYRSDVLYCRVIYKHGDDGNLIEREIYTYDTSPGTYQHDYYAQHDRSRGVNVGQTINGLPWTIMIANENHLTSPTAPNNSEEAQIDFAEKIGGQTFTSGWKTSIVSYNDEKLPLIISFLPLDSFFDGTGTSSLEYRKYR